MRRWFKIALWKRMAMAMLLGCATGVVIDQLSTPTSGVLLSTLHAIGEIFIRLIRMLIVPLVFSSIVASVCSIGSAKRLRPVGISAAIVYISTSLIACVLGLSASAIMGIGSTASFADTDTTTAVPEAPERLSAVIPDNLFVAFFEGNILAIVLFALLFGIGVLYAGDKGRVAGSFFESCSEAILKTTVIALEFAPIGVFALIAFTAGTHGLDVFRPAGSVLLALCVATLLHAVFLINGLIQLFLKLSPIQFLRNIAEALLVAFSTASSAATLPIAITNATEKLGIRMSIAASVLPLGTVINMNGTALYLGILAAYTANAFGYALELQHYCLIAITATVAAAAAPGLPSASLLLLGSVLAVVDVPPEHVALVIGVVFPFDRIPDMIRTALNVTGNMVAVAIVDRWTTEERSTNHTTAVA